ncbi:MAG TPA: GntR family transcriptional regulator [Bryobacteraceae bacterium]|nr:GntR family transcriptional regulator [Bryobacteraceae bacterium]
MPAREKRLPQPVRSDSLAVQTFTILKEAIFAGKFQPGEAVLEMHLAKSLQVSQATVREALVLLEQAGLVVKSQGRRTTITSLTREEVRDRLSIRIALEEIACVKAAARMREADFRELDKLAKRIAENIGAGDWLRMTLADARFHHLIWERAEAPILLRTLDQITTPLFAFLGALHADGPRDLQSGKRHEAIVEALKSRDPKIARKAIRDHIQGSYRTFLDEGELSVRLRNAQSP